MDDCHYPEVTPTYFENDRRATTCAWPITSQSQLPIMKCLYPPPPTHTLWGDVCIKLHRQSIEVVSEVYVDMHGVEVRYIYSPLPNPNPILGHSVLILIFCCICNVCGCVHLEASLSLYFSCFCKLTLASLFAWDSWVKKHCCSSRLCCALINTLTVLTIINTPAQTHLAHTYTFMKQEENQNILLVYGSAQFSFRFLMPVSLSAFRLQ